MDRFCSKPRKSASSKNAGNNNKRNMMKKLRGAVFDPTLLFRIASMLRSATESNVSTTSGKNKAKPVHLYFGTAIDSRTVLLAAGPATKSAIKNVQKDEAFKATDANKGVPIGAGIKNMNTPARMLSSKAAR